MKQQGITLIELLIVVAIVGILSAIAYPAYQGYVENSRRTVAQGELLELAQWMERQYTVAGAYPTDTASLPPSNLTETGNNNPLYYTATIAAGAAGTNYQLIITPVAGSSQVSDKCGLLFITHTGEKGQASGAPATCWRN